MGLNKLINDFRKEWAENEDKSRDYNVAFAILHGQLERLPPEALSQKKIERYFHNSLNRLKKAKEPASLIVPNIMEFTNLGFNVLVHNQGKYALSTTDIESISRVQGYFGIVEEESPERLRIILLDEKDEYILDDISPVTSILNDIEFPLYYRKAGKGVCWVGYQFKNRNPLGTFEPAST